jgi:pyruvate/2-oxoacid:ferredoxin oxidoreductase alpha subunit
MMEPVEFPQQAIEPPPPEWAVTGTQETRGNLITSLHLDCDEMEAHLHHLEAKYKCAQQREVRAEEWHTDGAEIVLVGYGIVGRILKAVAAEARAGGLNVGVLRPITLYPFPNLHFQRLAATARVFVVVEMSNGQMLEDVRLALDGARPVEFLSRMGGNVPSHEEVLRFVRELTLRYLPGMAPEEERLANV